MNKAQPQLFFGVGTGRCGTMLLANLLNSEQNVCCLHEGKFRDGEDAGEQMLDFLTLQNLAAYHQPSSAPDLLHKHRGAMASIAAENASEVFGDIAYNYAPFIGSIPAILPSAKLIVLIRDGREFVRSAITDESPDPTPVGWLNRRPVDRVERFIGLGRLRPRPTDPLAEEWDDLSLVAKNGWLWAETNRLIIEGCAAWPDGQKMVIRFEKLFDDLPARYGAIRDFLGLENIVDPVTEKLFARPINKRAAKPLPPYCEWTASEQADFERHAGAMMEELRYG